MKKLFLRPLAFSCAAFVLFMAAGYFYPNFYPYTVIFAVIAATMTFLAFLIFRKRKCSRVLFAFFLAFLFGTVSLVLTNHYYYVRQERVERYYGQTVTVSAECTDIVFENELGGLYEIKSSFVNKEAISEGFRLYTNTARIKRGELFSMSVIISPFENDADGYAQRTVLMGDGFRAMCEQTEGEFLSEGMANHPVRDFFETIRARSAKMFTKALGNRTGALFTAVFCGDSSYMSDADISAVRRTGTSHLLAVSGMHFSVMMGMLSALICSFGIGIRPRFVILSVCALFYALFTGMPPSVLRCAVMLLITYIGAFVGKQGDLPTSLFVSMALILTFRPDYFLSASFWLSCSATFGIILISPALKQWFSHKHKDSLSDILYDDDYTVPYRIVKFVFCSLKRFVCAIPEFLVASVLSGVCAVLFSMPFSMLFFENSSITALPCGILLSLIVDLILIASPFVIVLGGIEPIADAVSCIGELFYSILDFFSDMKGIYINMDYPAVKVLLLLFFAIVFMSVLAGNKRKLLSVFCCVVFCLTYVFAYASDVYEFSEPRSVYVATSDSDGLCVRTSEGMVIADMGSKTRSDIKKVMTASSKLKKNDIDTYVFTSVPPNLEDLVTFLVTNYKVERVCFPNHAVKAYSVICDAAAKRAQKYGCDVICFDFGGEISVCGGTLSVSRREYIKGMSVPSYCVSAEFGEEKILWISRGVFEGSGVLDVYAEEYKSVIFGVYGPKLKTECAADIGKIKAQSILFGADDSDVYYEKLQKEYSLTALTEK